MWIHFRLFKRFHYTYFCICGKGVGICLWSSEDNLYKSMVSFYQGGPGVEPLWQAILLIQPCFSFKLLLFELLNVNYSFCFKIIMV